MVEINELPVGDAFNHGIQDDSTEPVEGSFWWWCWWLSVIFVGWVMARFLVASISRYFGWDLDYEMKKLSHTDKVEPYHNGVKYAVSYWSDMGKRPYQEDRHQELRGKGGGANIGSDCSLYGVFDGHGGYRASQYCKERLLQYINADENFPNNIESAIKSGFYKIDAEFSANAKLKLLSDGSTALVACINNRRLYIGNAGDCRAILIKKPAETDKPQLTGNHYHDTQLKYDYNDIDVLTSDHKPNRPDEEQRIKKLGGRVVHWGRWRVQGVLAVSRAIGDVNLQPYVTCDPEICSRNLEDNDVIIVIASDGVWDALSNEHVARCVMQAVYTKPWIQVARELCDEAKIMGSTDNITAQIIDLTGQFCPIDDKVITANISKTTNSVIHAENDNVNSKKSS